MSLPFAARSVGPWRDPYLTPTRPQPDPNRTPTRPRRAEAARYAAELAKQEDEARRAKQPLEKLQRPTLVSRTDGSITLNLYRNKSMTQTLPSDRCWELSLKKEREHSYAVGRCRLTLSNPR